MRVRVLSRYTRVVKQSNSVSLENPTTEGDLCFGGFIRQNYQTWSCRPQRPVSGASQAQSLTRQNGLATKNSLGSLGLPAFFLLNQTHEVWFSLRKTLAFVMGTSAAHLPWKRLYLTSCTHSNESKRNTIYSITQRCIRLNKNKGLVEPLVFI